MSSTPPSLSLRRPAPDLLEIGLVGCWQTGERLPDMAAILGALNGAEIRRVCFATPQLGGWDSFLLTYLVKILAACRVRDIMVDRDGLPTGVNGMLALAQSVPERQDAARAPEARGLPDLVGQRVLAFLRDFWGMVDFVGESTQAFGRLLVGRARFRSGDLWRLFQECGPNALPIVSLISLLVGMILAFIGAVQLRLFGAQVFIADLVGLGVAREMGAMMTAILLAGRTGAAFAAELGSMQVNDELDAFRTSGFPPLEFLVLPRILALFAATPFLCIYADILGMLGGALVSSAIFDISFAEYFFQIRNRLTLTDFGVGIGKSAVFGILVAMAGCLRGLQCGRSSNAVGLATTSAVVTGIVFIIVADAVMNLLVATLNIYQK